ncbi:PREDICTED: glutathione S-transferase U28-like [Camelina sativa]|uniref:Glutathione S-transferase U28-like n=1 Tax=Camelina sativa TaxID=90675 RepID=A0ABM0X5T1_CAMSA|nr:PREDICTED: glutathione S-transferase U28-like [Camelina sativa]
MQISFEGGRKIWGNKIGEEHDKGIKEFLEREHEVLVPFYSWFYALEECGDFSVEAACPKIVAWGKRCVERNSVAASLPESEKVINKSLCSD